MEVGRGFIWGLQVFLSCLPGFMEPKLNPEPQKPGIVGLQDMAFLPGSLQEEDPAVEGLRVRVVCIS